MMLAEFTQSVADYAPPAGVTPALSGLWWSAKGDWDRAHRIVMDESSPECAWVHAYLHRVEGDLGNAGFWYNQARRPVASGGLVGEWRAIAAALLTP